MAAVITTELAPYAVVRVAALPHPGPPAGAAGFRAAMAAAVAARARVRGLAPEVADALHDSAADHPPEFHRRVVLPLRRDVHNDRSPRPALLAELGELPDRVPVLARWLAERAALDAATDALLTAWPAALAAERAVLARVCDAEPVRLAGVLTGADLLHGLARTAAGGGTPDRKARKAEATVLRYALRATAKTSPLSWYTHVGWGYWGDGPWPSARPVAHTEVNRLLLARLVDAFRDRPHRLAPGLHDRDGRVVFRRDAPIAPGADAPPSRIHVTREEQVDLAATGPLRFVVATARAAGAAGVEPSALVGALAARMSTPDARAAARGYVERMLDIGLLVPVEPVHPQDPDAPSAIVAWLRERGAHDAADRLARLVATTAAFATADPPARAVAAAALDTGWRELGERVGVDLSGIAPVLEDVLLPEPVPAPATGTDALTRLTPLLVLFDHQVLLRRLLRNRFVESVGAGGVATLAECAVFLAGTWKDTADAAEWTGDPEVVALLEARAKLAAAAPADGVLTDDLVDEAAHHVPTWLRRPGSYAFFGQPSRDGRLVVNHVYPGFGRFTSRFLRRLPGAADAVAARLRRTLGARFAQFRPLRGFNANLHPLLAPHEVGEDARWADLPADELLVRHDPVADELRVVHRGEPLDVVYLGFLMPLVLPDRYVPLYSDLACGRVGLEPLRSSEADGEVVRRGGLRYRDVVLARRAWDFPTAPALGAEEEVAPAVAAWRARHGLPGHVFVDARSSSLSADFLSRRLIAAKPQYVDLGNALHLRCLPRLLSRFPDGVELTEALPVPGAGSPGGRVLEVVAETYWEVS
ncbi:lantibiotic dehydratase [Saccharothrix australiensis]|uniref:Lantibiotic biosynthesis dehydratase-like protein n=1 Tax=Saccharothrix australiensis TaxID=2072 RepID=A0A495VZ72_9PSEU|nr:lantibiotic dehydratase [Saccharothrix australiensis]RKT54741.1 lantibiotic biosynthesis dehydratase-like protein [Saccharothrix australiensis]